MNANKSKLWFWAWTVLATYQAEKRTRNPKCLVWKNLIIVSGNSEYNAFAKAEKIGRASQSGAGDDVRLNGKRAVTKFLGISEMGFIHDPLEDGCELYFRESHSTLKSTLAKIPQKAKIVASLRKELQPYRNIKWNPHSLALGKRK